MGSFAQSSPYIANSNRLVDVIAAIQALGSYEFHMASFSKWAYQISGDSSKGDYWKNVFEDHPEFFRLDTTRTLASLVLRRQQPKLYNVDSRSVITKAEAEKLDDTQKKRVSRGPIGPDQVEALINVAINLHSHAAERERDKRWWLPPAFAFGGALVGGIIPAIIKISSSPMVP